MLAAMKGKQTVEAGNATKLRASILKFYEAYEGKKPRAHGHDHGDKHDHGHKHDHDHGKGGGK